MQVRTPTTLVIFGATGDLAKRKLFYALFSLFKQGMLPKKFKIVGFAKSDMTDKDFQKFDDFFPFVSYLLKKIFRFNFFCKKCIFIFLKIIILKNGGK